MANLHPEGWGHPCRLILVLVGIRRRILAHAIAAATAAAAPVGVRLEVVMMRERGLVPVDENDGITRSTSSAGTSLMNLDAACLIRRTRRARRVGTGRGRARVMPT
jgi:hypothetical protein